jgi:hypothetical protein
MRRSGTVLACVLVVAGLAWMPTSSPIDDATLEPAPALAGGRHRGISFAQAGGRRGSFTGYGSDASAESLGLLAALGVNWISVMPYAYQATPQDTEIRWGARRDGSDPDERLRQVTRQAHDLGINVMMKPHVWLRPPDWVGLIAHESDANWARWFASYRALILHYARLAADAGIDALCIGNELDKTTSREAEWRSLIAEIRDIYGGALTYGAGFEGVYDVPFWDAVDFIGLSAYFKLVDGASPDRASLVAAWRPTVGRLAALSQRWHRPIVFTELGYRSASHATQHPWFVDRDAVVDLELQVAAYEAFFEAVWPQPWFGGVYWWKWFSRPDHGGPDDNDYSPRGKPAEAVLRRHFATDASS